MQFIPIQTGILKEGDDIAQRICEPGDLRSGDIVVISAKAIAAVEGAVIDLSTIDVTDEALRWAEQIGGRKPAEFRQAILNEAKRMNGEIVGTCPKAMLAELKPEGLESGTIMAVNAGLDMSNVGEGFAVGWPRDLVDSMKKIRRSIEQHMNSKVSGFRFQVSGSEAVLQRNVSQTAKLETCKLANLKLSPHDSEEQQNNGRKIGVIISDSCCHPRRIGVGAMALTVSGIDPLISQIGREDLFGHELRMTKEAVADQLATAANFLMGNAAQGIPAVFIRDHGLAFSDFEGWVPGIAREEDLFQGLF